MSGSSPTCRLFLAATCLLALSACAVVDLSLLSDDYKKEKETVEVSAITAPLRATPSDMPSLYCRAGEGEALFGRQWHPFATTLFILHQGHYSNLAFARKSGQETMTLQAVFDDSGQKMIFCPFVTSSNPAERIPCTSLYTIETDLNDGIKRTFEIPGAIRGAMISCAYDRAHLQPLTPPIEGGL